MADIEVEIKFPVSKKLFNRINEKLSKITKLEDQSQEIDIYFNPPHKDFFKPAYPVEYFRLRQAKTKNSLAYKRPYFNQSGQRTHSNEFETEINQPKQLLKILQKLDFKKMIIIDKTRKRFNFQNQLEIDLDEVKKLGYFVEIENKKAFKKLKMAIDFINDFAQKLGIDPQVRNDNGYVLLMMKKLGWR